MVTTDGITRLPSLREEAEAMAQKHGYYIPPYRMAELVNTANKVVKTLTGGTFQPTYEECRMVLHIVNQALNLGCPEP